MFSPFEHFVKLNQGPVVNSSENPETIAPETIMQKFFPYASTYARSVMDLITLYVSVTGT